jgi:phosphoglycerate dehydrogenase-like enzyme
MAPPIKVAVLDDYQGVALSMADWKSLGPGVSVHTFRDSIPADALADRLSDFAIIVAMRERTPFPRTLIERLSSLKLLVTTGRRNASIDIKAAADRGIPVSGTATLSTPPTELTWGLILSLARHIPEEATAMRTGGWQATVGMGLHGKVLGVVGLGRLGSEVAKIGSTFGMNVIAWSQNLTADVANTAGARLVDKMTLFRESDVVTIHLVLSPRSRGLVGETELNAMKPTAYLINTARGPIVDEAALVAALRARRIAGAGLDVFDQEPLPADHPLRALDNVLLTPHLGYVTADNYRWMYTEAVEDIRAFLDGKPIRVIAPQ